MNILGIETSCDETSVALLKDGAVVRDEVYTQEIHSRYGGVVPEEASRAHLRKIDTLCHAVFDNTSMSPGDIDLLAVTDSPGLPGALLVGISFALGMHTAYRIPVTGIDHLVGHLHSVFLEHPDPSFPFIGLIVSGGHTSLVKVENFESFTLLGRTVDDAAGEAFDKVGKLLGFSYPAGRAIEQAASRADFENKIRFPVARLDTPGVDFSFSGLKTAVKYYLSRLGSESVEPRKPAICRAFQDAVIESLRNGLEKACERTGIHSIAVVGGVACNTALKTALRDAFGDSVMVPSPRYCTDNASMIARAGYEKFRRGTLRFPRMYPSSPIG